MTGPSAAFRADRKATLACAAAAAAAGLVYLNALHNPFVYDDYHTVVANISIRNIAWVRAIVMHDVARPLVNVSYAIDRALWGARPLGFHATNIVLHMLNVVLLFELARRLREDSREGFSAQEDASSVRPTVVAFATAAFFAVHPMMTEAVGYISGRSEVLSATFFLLACLCGRRWILTDGAPWGALTAICWCAALATKETAAMFPFVLLAFDQIVVRGDAAAKHRRLCTVHAPLMAGAVALAFIRLVVLARVEYPGQVTPHWSYALLAVDVVRRYVALLLRPAGQTMFHEVAVPDGVLDPRVLLAFGIIGLLVAVTWRVRRVEPTASFGILWFFLLLLPSAALTVLDRGEPMAEHRVYLASCGLFLAAGTAIGWLSAWLMRTGRHAQMLGRAGFALVLLAFAAQTALRNEVWANPVALWRESADLAPTHYRPRLLLAEALQDVGRRDEAIAEYTTAIRLRPGESTGYVKMGVCLAEGGRFEEARRYLQQAAAMAPRDESARRALTLLDTIAPVK